MGTTILAILSLTGIFAFLANRYGVLGKLDDTARLRANQGVDAMTTAIEKKKMQIQKLRTLLEQQADALTTLDAQVGTAEDERADAQRALDAAVRDLQDMQEVRPDDAAAISRLAAAVSTAEQLRDTRKNLVDELKSRASQAHADYEDSVEIFRERQNELPQAEATATLTRALQVKAVVSKYNRSIKDAAAAGDDADRELRQQLHKAQAEADLNGPSQDERVLKEARQSRTTQDILSRYGKKTPGIGNTDSGQG